MRATGGRRAGHARDRHSERTRPWRAETFIRVRRYGGAARSLTSVFDIPALARHLPDPIVVIDGGCRWGFGQQWDALVPWIRLYGFDSDEEEVQRLVKGYADQPHVCLTAATLGSAPGKALLFRTEEPAGTSVFEPTIGRAGGHLATWDGTTIESTAPVDVVTLDSQALELRVGRVDALKLDTQGSELDILQGATDVLRDVRHVEAEVAFNEIGEGAPLFGAVDAFLRTEPSRDG